MDELLRQEVRFLTTRLGAIVSEQSGPRVFPAIEVLRKAAKQLRQSPNPELLKTKERAVRRLTDEVREGIVTPQMESENGRFLLERTIHDLAGSFWDQFLGGNGARLSRPAKPFPSLSTGGRLRGSWYATDLRESG
jgi:hypothetical protein